MGVRGMKRTLIFILKIAVITVVSLGIVFIFDL